MKKLVIVLLANLSFLSNCISQNEIETVSINNLEWTKNPVDINIKREKDSIHNGIRLYTINQAKQIVNDLENFRLPTIEDLKYFTEGKYSFSSKNNEAKAQEFQLINLPNLITDDIKKKNKQLEMISGFLLYDTNKIQTKSIYEGNRKIKQFKEIPTITIVYKMNKELLFEIKADRNETKQKYLPLILIKK